MRPQAFPSTPQISDAPRRHSRHAPFTHPIPRSCPPPRSRPSFPSFPCSSQGQALRRQESMRPQAFPSALQLTDGPPPLAPRSLHPPQPSVLPSPSFPPLLPVIPLFKPGAGSAQAGIHATSSLPSALQLIDAPPTSPAAPPSHQQRLTPRSCPCTRRSHPSFRSFLPLFSVIPAQAGIHATSSFPSALQLTDAPPHHLRHAPFTHPIPRSCPPPRSRPSFPSFPCSSQGQALRRQESMRPQASRQRPRSATARRHSRHAPLHPRHPSVLPSPSFPPLFSVIPAQAGIHATSSFPSTPQISDGPPPLTPLLLRPPTLLPHSHAPSVIHPRGDLRATTIRGWCQSFEGARSSIARSRCDLIPSLWTAATVSIPRSAS